MKTPMQEHIERLKEMHKHFSSEWEMDIAAGLGYAIDHAEAMLEKEKEFMQKVYANAKATGEMDEAVRTFNTKEK